MIKNTKQSLVHVLVGLIINANESIKAVRENRCGHIDILSSINGENMEIYIIDNGRGMSKIDQEMAFDPFHVMRGANGQRKYSLHVAQHIINVMHGGTIDMQSEEVKNFNGNHQVTPTHKQAKHNLSSGKFPDLAKNTVIYMKDVGEKPKNR